MAISEVCQFELKEEIDKLKEKNPGRSLSQCINDVIKYYAEVGIELKKSTAKAKYHRASKTVANATTPVITEYNNENNENQEIKMQHGGFRDGSGRKPKWTDDEDSDALFNLKRLWKKATKKDRKAFLIWIKGENK